ncbi:MAG: hypothetical protein L0H31_03805 [Nocardioidaceae bacterium]|nr:hypothetical protein [Nocardioidaceae bacterium]
MRRCTITHRRGDYDVPGFGSVRRAGVMRPSKTLRDLRGREFNVWARTRTSTVTDQSGTQLGMFRRNFWTRHGVLTWGQETYRFRVQMWSSRYRLEQIDGRELVSIKLRALGDGDLSTAEDVDPVTVLFAVALAMITRSYTGASAAAASS